MVQAVGPKPFGSAEGLFYVYPSATEGLRRMMTVKHVLNGQEHLYSAPHGASYIGPLSSTGIGGPHLAIPLHDAGANPAFGVACKALHGGHVYVMNDAGATVGSYELGEPPLSATA
jgi:hypothetical protein